MNKKLQFILELVSEKFKAGVGKAQASWQKLMHTFRGGKGESKKLSAEVDKLGKTLDRSSVKSEKAASSTEKLKASQTKLTQATKKGATASKKKEGALKRLGKTMVAQISMALGLTTAITRLVSAFSEGLKVAIQTEKGFAEINTLYAGSNGLTENTKKLIIQQSKLFGRDIQTNQKAFYDIVSSGITDQAEAMKVLEASNKLAVGGLTETGQAADLLTSVMNSYGHETYTATQVTDLLFQTVRKGKTTINELQASLGQVLPIASKTGTSLEEVGAALATMTAGGAKTAEAVTFLKNVLKAVVKKEGPEAARMFKELIGYDFDVAAIKAKGFQTVLLDLIRATKGNADVLGKLIPDIRGLGGVLSLAGNNGQTFAENMEAMFKAAGATDEAFGKMSETMDQKMKVATQEFSAEWALLLENLGGIFLFLNKLRGAGAEILNQFFSFTNEKGKELKETLEDIKETTKSFFEEDTSGQGFFEGMVSRSKAYLNNIKKVGKEQEKQRQAQEEERKENLKYGYKLLDDIVYPQSKEVKFQTTQVKAQEKVKIDAAKKQNDLVKKYKDVLGEGFPKIIEKMSEKLEEGLEKIKKKTEEILAKIRGAFSGGAFQDLAGAREFLKDDFESQRIFKQLTSRVDIKSLSSQAIKSLAQASKELKELGSTGELAFDDMARKIEEFRGQLKAQDVFGIVSAAKTAFGSDDLSNMLTGLFQKSIGALETQAIQEGRKKMEALSERILTESQKLVKDLAEKSIKDLDDRKAVAKLLKDSVGVFDKGVEKFLERAKNLTLKVDAGHLQKAFEITQTKSTQNKTSIPSRFR